MSGPTEAFGVKIGAPYYGPDKWVSPQYLWPETEQFCTYPTKVLIHDVTLRDGDQMARVVLKPDEKILIARALDALGVHSIEPCFPIHPQDKEVLAELVRMNLKSKIVPLARVKAEDVRACLDAKPHGVLLEMGLNPYILREVFRKSPEDLIDEVSDYAAECKQQGLYVEFMAWDVFRIPDKAWLQSFFTRLSEKAALDRITVADTFGMNHPLATFKFVRMLREWTQKPLGLHIHNDFGMGVGNSVMAVSAGADMIHASVNGIGERAGNVATEEVAFALQYLLGIDTGVDLAQVSNTSAIVEELSRVKSARNKPITGSGLFEVESGIVVHIIENLKKSELGGDVFFPFPPRVAGRPQHTVIPGRGVGRQSIKVFLDQRALTADEDTIGRIADRIRSIALVMKNAIPDTMLDLIIAEEVGSMGNHEDRP